MPSRYLWPPEEMYAHYRFSLFFKGALVHERFEQVLAQILLRGFLAAFGRRGADIYAESRFGHTHLDVDRLGPVGQQQDTAFRTGDL